MAAEAFALQVKILRKRLSMTQAELASKLGVNFATINRWENGHSEPSKLARIQFETFKNNLPKKESS